MTQSNVKILAAIYINGDDLDPDMVSTVIGTPASKSQRRGAKIISGSGREFIIKTSVWSLFSEEKSEIISDHFIWLQRKVGRISEKLADMHGLSDAYVDVFYAPLAASYEECTCEFELDGRAIAAIKEIGLPIRWKVTFSQD